MALPKTESHFKLVELHCERNNTEHHTNQILETQLIVRRGQAFNVTLTLTDSFSGSLHPLVVTATTGRTPLEEERTLSRFSVPGDVKTSSSVKGAWHMELHQSSVTSKGVMKLIILPPASAPVGEYTLKVKYKGEELLLAHLVLLFNPWCLDDWVFLPDEDERQEYVLNEEGIVYRGSVDYISSMHWDFGQFEDNMVNICMKLLDLSHKHIEDPADDVSNRYDPMYVSRIVSAMINSEDEHGVLKGRWGGSYFGGHSPAHWNGSHPILNQWLKTYFSPVKYGQCWVFAGVMCSVMRFLGIPCRVVTNFVSAHDNNGSLTIDTYYGQWGLGPRRSQESIWNFHVWVEGWMKRPDLSDDGRYDGWQVLDPTPQEMSGGVYCCGPAPVRAILSGETHLKYDIPFVFAEVNADCISWLVRPDGSLLKISSDPKRVGQNISTKSVGSEQRQDITSAYKHVEGSIKERAVFKYARTRDYSIGHKDDGWDAHSESEEEVTHEEDDQVPDVPDVPARPKLSIRFKEEAKPVNGKDVSLSLLLRNKSAVDLSLSVMISAQAMNHVGTPTATLLTQEKDVVLQRGKELSIPVLIEFLVYNKPMLECPSMKVSVVVTQTENPENIYVAEDDIVLLDPPISLTMPSEARLYWETMAELIFMNPVNQILSDCSVTFSGTGLLREELQIKIPDIRPGNRVVVRLPLRPYKLGKKTLAIDLDCSVFKDVKSWCNVTVRR